jgi:hypothetical protein
MSGFASDSTYPHHPPPQHPQHPQHPQQHPQQNPQQHPQQHSNLHPTLQPDLHPYFNAQRHPQHPQHIQPTPPGYEQNNEHHGMQLHVQSPPGRQGAGPAFSTPLTPSKTKGDDSAKATRLGKACDKCSERKVKVSWFAFDRTTTSSDGVVSAVPVASQLTLCASRPCLIAPFMIQLLTVNSVTPYDQSAQPATP